MKTLKGLASGCILSLFLGITAVAGDMPGPGFCQNKPNNTSATQQSSCAAISEDADEKALAAPTEEATPNLIDDAIIIAIQLLTRVW